MAGIFKIKFSGPIFTIEIQRFTERMQEAIRKRMRVSARAFIRAAVTTGLVPIDTGMARGSFLNIGALLKVAIPAYGGRTGAWYYTGGEKLPKTPETGAELSTQAPQVFSDNGKVFKFYYGTDVIHYNINDFFPHTPGAPWGSYEAGGNAFISEMLNGKLKKYIPSIKSAILVGRITSASSTLGIKKRLIPEEPIEDDT